MKNNRIESDQIRQDREISADPLRTDQSVAIARRTATADHEGPPVTTTQNDHPNETAARGLDSFPEPDDDGIRLKRAVIYLRVSSAAQVNTDYDPEGISIPAQRSSCERKVVQMDGVEIVGEFVEPGRSGTSMEGRPAFQAMLQRIREDRDIDYVVIYKLSRMNRNRLDDALVMAQLRQFGVTLVSATEMIDETPEGQLMHGVLASFNEFRSAADGADIRYKMREKAKRGGTVSRAPLGYTNVRETFEGRELSTVAIDPVRGPLVKEAFELFATGEYTLATLCDELSHRGLQTRPGRFPAGPLSDSKLSTLLRDPYYLGVVTFKGEQFDGRHEPLIDQELFDAVQAVISGRRISGERQRVHHHYLKGTLFCGACHERGRDSRLLIQKSTGRRGGVYFYFFCTAKQRKECNEPYLPLDDVESAVGRHYATLPLESDLVDLVREDLASTMADLQAAARTAQRHREGRLAKLDRQEENLLDLVADGEVDSDRAKSRIRRIAAEREQLKAQVDLNEEGLTLGAAVVGRTIELLDDSKNLYESSSGQGRRLINHAIFNKLYITSSEVTDDELHEPFAGLVELDRTLHEMRSGSVTQNDLEAPINQLFDRMWPRNAKSRSAVSCRRPLVTVTSRLAAALAGEGSSKDVMVEDLVIQPDDGERRVVTLRAFPLPDHSVGVSLEDVTDAVAASEALRQQALYDGLTGLPNRRALDDELHRVVSQAPDRGNRVALLVMDLDQFKEVNDALGHHVGDELLRGIGDRLSATIDDALIARLGGDEFAVVMAGAVTIADAVAMAESIRETLSTPFLIDAVRLQSNASIGIALFPDQAPDVASLVQRADVAMYVAKRTGSGVAVYASEQDRSSIQRITLLGDLAGAVADGEFELHYQPSIDVRTGVTMRVEALARWNHPVLGQLQPAQFIELAALSGAIHALTHWAIEEGLRAASVWRKAGHDVGLAVNLSMRNLYDPTLIGQLTRQLESSGVPAEALVLELTETELMDDPGVARKMFTNIGALGINTSIDDFGTGYSSLTYLRDLPLQEIKIDRSFVREMVRRSDEFTIVRSMIDLGHNLGLEVVAEGVEHRDDLELLARLGCDYAQGYHISRPMPLGDLLPWLARHQADATLSEVTTTD